MSPDDRALLAPYLTRERLSREQVLVHAGRPVDHAWFPEGGVGSVVSISPDGDRTEVGIFGNEGMAGTSLLLGVGQAPHEVFMQLDHATGLRIGAAPFLAAVERSASLRLLLLRYVHTCMVQMATTATSNAQQRMEGRLARWLVMCHDRVEGDELPLTHRFMAMMIGAERSGVTVALHILEGAGMIRSTRGRVTIVDRDKLEEVAGDTYGRSEREYSRLIAPFGKGER